MAHILLSDDEESVRAFVERALETRGHTVHAVADGSAALAALAGEESFDLLLTDIVMPVMDGIALALKVARDYPEMPILMMTGYADEEHRAHNLDLLIHEVVSKPFTIDEICDAVEAALTADPKNA